MPARGSASNRQTAVNRQLASGRLSASNRQYVAGGGGAVDDMTFLDSVVVGAGGAANVTFSGIPAAYRHLMVFYVARSHETTSAQTMLCQVNGDGGANYDTQRIGALNTTVSAGQAIASTSMEIGIVAESDGPAGMYATGDITFVYYSTTTQDKFVISHAIYSIGTGSGQFLYDDRRCGWRTANAAISSMVYTPASGTFAENSRFSLYGIT